MEQEERKVTHGPLRDFSGCGEGQSGTDNQGHKGDEKKGGSSGGEGMKGNVREGGNGRLDGNREPEREKDPGRGSDLSCSDGVNICSIPPIPCQRAIKAALCPEKKKSATERQRVANSCHIPTFDSKMVAKKKKRDHF